jgi:hypothetical protein
VHQRLALEGGGHAAIEADLESTPIVNGSSTVLITSRSFSSGELDLVAELRAARLTVAFGDHEHELPRLAPMLAQAVGWIAGTGPVTAAHLSAAPLLRIVARYGVGVDAVRRMSHISGGAAYPIYAPLLLDDPAAARSLRSQAKVAEALGCYDRINLAIVPMGSWDPPQSQLYDSITAQERGELLGAGVRADTSTVLLSGSGEILTPPLSQRMIGITGEQLRRIPEVVAVAGGVDKAGAVGVVLRAGFVTTLITNASVAQELLKQAPPAALTSQPSSAPDR